MQRCFFFLSSALALGDLPPALTGSILDTSDFEVIRLNGLRLNVTFDLEALWEAVWARFRGLLGNPK